MPDSMLGFLVIKIRLSKYSTSAHPPGRESCGASAWAWVLRDLCLDVDPVGPPPGRGSWGTSDPFPVGPPPGRKSAGPPHVCVSCVTSARAWVLRVLCLDVAHVRPPPRRRSCGTSVEAWILRDSWEKEPAGASAWAWVLLSLHLGVDLAWPLPST